MWKIWCWWALEVTIAVYVSSVVVHTRQIGDCVRLYRALWPILRKILILVGQLDAATVVRLNHLPRSVSLLVTLSDVHSEWWCLWTKTLLALSLLELCILKALQVYFFLVSKKWNLSAWKMLQLCCLIAGQFERWLLSAFLIFLISIVCSVEFFMFVRSWTRCLIAGDYSQRWHSTLDYSPPEFLIWIFWLCFLSNFLCFLCLSCPKPLSGPWLLSALPLCIGLLSPQRAAGS